MAQSEVERHALDDTMLRVADSLRWPRHKAVGMLSLRFLKAGYELAQVISRFLRNLFADLVHLVNDRVSPNLGLHTSVPRVCRS